MQPVDGSYLYKVGAALTPLESIVAETLWGDAWFPILIAQGELQQFINNSVYSPSVRASRENAEALVALLAEASTEAQKDENRGVAVGAVYAYRLKEARKNFETVLTAEFRLTPLFLVTPKRGYDLQTLVFAGAALFPESLTSKVPEAVEDVRLGARCLAFELLTAAAFHLHRANETVLRKYWEAKRPGKPHPAIRTLGGYLTALGRARKGSPKVKASLRDIKDLYRNPVLHPDYQLKNVDETIALFGSIHTAIVQMLDEIPEPPKTPS